MVKHAERLSDLTDAVLMCRDLGHPWEPVTDRDIITERGGRIIEFTRVHRCARCTAERRQVIRIPGWYVATSTITYPDGYLFSGRHVRKAEVRREVLDRIVRSRA